MKRLTCAIAAAVLTGCGHGNVAVELTPEGAGYVMANGSKGAGLSNTAAARSVTVSIAEVSAHLAGDEPEDPDESGSGWQVISSSRRDIDLHAIPVGKGELLGDAVLPAGKITQLRVRLARMLSDDELDGRVVLHHVVVEPDGMRCDLSVPSSAFDPGLKLTGAFKAIDVDPATRATFIVAIDLKDAARIELGDDCVWALNPVIRLHDVRSE